MKLKARELAKESSIEALATMVALMRSAKDEKVRAAMAREVWNASQEVADAYVRDPLRAAEVATPVRQLTSEALAEIARGGPIEPAGGPHEPR